MNKKYFYRYRGGIKTEKEIRKKTRDRKGSKKRQIKVEKKSMKNGSKYTMDKSWRKKKSRKLQLMESLAKRKNGRNVSLQMSSNK